METSSKLHADAEVIATLLAEGKNAAANQMYRRISQSLKIFEAAALADLAKRRALELATESDTRD